MLKYKLEKMEVILNDLGFYDILVNGTTVCEMVAKEELADAIEAVMKDQYGMVADMLEE